ncbi:MAG: Arm DNA-binding domain-containing protein [Desulfovibrio sp.]|jgi:hypothetical protein|nr:Arm DNA-binding domain-containing protein [Desulfovibrio sp.]
MPLTDSAIKALKPEKHRRCKVFAGNSLYIEVHPTGSKSGSQFNTAFGTAVATADTIIARDENGRAQISAPVQAEEIANKGYVDTTEEEAEEEAAELRAELAGLGQTG